MSNRSTNDTSYNINCEAINNLQYTIAKLKSEIEEILIPINTQENKGLIGELDKYCDEVNKIPKNNNYLYYSNIDDIFLLFREKNKKDTNEYNIMNNYDIEFDSITNKTYLKNKRIKFEKYSKKEICNECYQINKKIKLREDMLLIVLVKKEKKDIILILIIEEKKKRDDEDDQKEKDEHEENNNFNYISDTQFHAFYKKYNFRLEIPQVGQNFSSYLLKKNGKEEIILYLWSDKKIYLFKIEYINDNYDDSYSIKTKYIFQLELEPIFIIPIKIILENKEFIFKKNEINFTEFFLVITKENKPKLCKYVEKVNILYICNIEYEFESEDDKKSILKNNPYHVEQLDNGLIAIHFKDENKDEIAHFFFNAKDQK